HPVGRRGWGRTVSRVLFSRRRERRATGRSSLSGGCRQPPLAAYPRLKRCGPHLVAAWPCSGRRLPCPRALRSGRWALTPPFHPCLCRALARPAIGGLLSVALAVASRRPGVTWRPALWSSDFPRPGLLPEPRSSRPTRAQIYAAGARPTVRRPARPRFPAGVGVVG